MIVCRKCSRRHADGTDFCACGAFLEFDGERVADDPPPPGASAPRPPAAPPPAPPPAGPSVPRTPAPPTPPAHSAAGGWGAAPTPAPTAEPSPWGGFEPATPAADAPTWGAVQAQLPDAPLAAAAADPVDARPTMRVGDVVCGRCATPNPPTRQFCQKCGQPLVAAAATAAAAGPSASRRDGWWTRFRRSLRRKGISTDSNRLATEAHLLSRGGLSGRTMLFRAGGVAIILGGFLAFLGPWRSNVTAWARDRVGGRGYDLVDVDPEQVTTTQRDPAVAPTPFPLQDAAMAVDRHRNTSWATAWLDPVGLGLDAPPDDRACQAEPRTDTFLHVSFPEPTDLSRLQLIAGRYDGDEQRGTFYRPAVVEVRWRQDGDDAATEDRCGFLVVADTGELTAHDFEHDDVTDVELRVVGVHADPESQPVVDISEVVFEH